MTINIFKSFTGQALGELSERMEYEFNASLRTAAAFSKVEYDPEVDRQVADGIRRRLKEMEVDFRGMIEEWVNWFTNPKRTSEAPFLRRLHIVDVIDGIGKGNINADLVFDEDKLIGSRFLIKEFHFASLIRDFFF